MGHEHDEPHLSQVGRFPGHVRPGENQDAGSVLAHSRVVRHEGLAGDQRLDHRMAPSVTTSGPDWVSSGAT